MPDVKMWGRALVRMPRVTAEEWARLDVVARWLIAVRAAVLTMTLSSCLLGGGLAMRAAQDGRATFSWPLWLATAFGLLMAHATNNLINDWTDHKKGTDKGNYFRTQYGVQPIEQGLMTMRTFYGYTAFTGGLALAAGLWLLHERSGHVLALFAAGVFFVLFYTWPLKYYGLGEFAVVAVWGPLMVGGTYYVVTGQWSDDAALAGTAYALGPTQVIFGKHIDKLQADELKHVRTLPVVIGERAARWGVSAIMVLQYAMLAWLVGRGVFSAAGWLALLSLGTFAQVWKVYRRPRPSAMPEGFLADVWPVWFAAWSFLHGARVGLFVLVGLLAELLFPGLRPTPR